MIRRDDTGERTENPTPMQLQRAADAGRVPRSADLSAAVVLLGMSILLAGVAPMLFGELKAMVASFLGGSGPAIDDAASARACVVQAIRPMLTGAALLAGGGCVLAAAAGAMPGGLKRRTRQDGGGLEGLSLWAGLRRLVSARSGARTGMAIVKLVAVGAVAGLNIRGAMPRIVATAGAAPATIVAEAGRMLIGLGLRVGLVLVALGLVDYLYQRWQHRRDLRMTRREVLEDTKEDMPDAGIRKRHRRLLGRGRTVDRA